MKMVAVMMLVLMLSLLLAMTCSGCSWSLFGERELDDIVPDGVSAPKEVSAEGSHPFPWGWTFGILTVGSLAAGAMIIKAPTLVDEVIVGTVGAMALIVGLEMVKEIWEMKWLLIGTLAGIAVGLAAWKLLRRWLLRPSEAGASDSLPVTDKPVKPELTKEN